jgi:NADP-dependent 3-hydroxy acid dehydrogenase YdfG
MFEINVFNLSRMIHAALPGMRKYRKGFIVNFSSIGGLRSFPSAYEAAMAKFEELRKDFSAWEAVSRGADFPKKKQREMA